MIKSHLALLFLEHISWLYPEPRLLAGRWLFRRAACLLIIIIQPGTMPDHTNLTSEAARSRLPTLEPGLDICCCIEERCVCFMLDYIYVNEQTPS